MSNMTIPKWMATDLLTIDKVPKYIREITSRLRFEPSHNPCPGYTFNLYGKWKVGYEEQLSKDAENLINWAKRQHADAYVVQEHFWYNEISRRNEYEVGYRNRQQRAYKCGYRNHITLVITDPVCRIFEKANFFKEGA